MNDRVVRDAGICGGKPIIRGTRVMIDVIIASLVGGDSPEEIVTDFPTITVEDVHAAVEFARAARSRRREAKTG